MKNNPENILMIPQNIRKDTKSYRKRVEKFVRGEMTSPQFKAYRIPMGIYEQRASGKYMVRIRIPAGIVLPHQLECIAGLSKIYGNGIIHVTTRQDLQIHDVAIENTPEVLEKLLEAGLSPRGGGGNTVRSITVCPRCGVCSKEAFDVAPYAIALSEYLLQNNSSFNLPRKFKIAFSGCSTDCASASVTDIGFFAHIRDGKKGFSVYAGGGLGSNSRTAIKIEDFIPALKIFGTTEAVKRLFDHHGDRTNKHRARLRYVLMRHGQKEFMNLYQTELEKIERGGLADPVPRIREIKRNNKAPSKLEEEIIYDFDSSFSRQIEDDKTPGLCSVRIALRRGDIPAGDLPVVGNLAEQYGEGFVRATQMQDLVICGVRKSDIQRVISALTELSIDIINISGISIVSCAGATTCKLGLCNSRGLARAIESEIADLKLSASKHETIIRISGCPNCCGHHHIGELGFEGRAKRIRGKLMPFYDVIFGAHVAEGEAHLGKRLASLPAKKVPVFTREILSLPEDLSFESVTDAVVRHKFISQEQIPSEYYNDFGSSKPFSLAGRGPGECGAGVMDLIGLDIDEAKTALEEAANFEITEEKGQALYGALLAGARALLVIFGQEPKSDQEVFDTFNRFLIEPGWVGPDARELIKSAADWKTGRKVSLEYQIVSVTVLVRRIEELFYSLDSNLKFKVEPLEKGIPRPLGVESRFLDLRGVACPMNFVRAKLELETIGTGEMLDILLDDGDPIRNVPASFEEEGQEVVEIKKEQEHFCVTVRKKN